jgi:hypothetical protein
MMTTSAQRRQQQTLAVSPDAQAILEDYHRFLQDLWGAAPTSPEDVLADALLVLVERYRAFREWRQQSTRQHHPAPHVVSRRSTHAHSSSLPIRHLQQRRRRV